MTDSVGTFPFLAVTALIGAVVGAVVGGVIAAANGGDATDILTGVAIGAAAGGLIGLGAGAVASTVLTGSALASTVEVASAIGIASAPAVAQTAENVCTDIQTYYPPNDGFYGPTEQVVLDPGTIIQRTGTLYGHFAAPVGTPQKLLSLPYYQIGQPTKLIEVIEPVKVTAGKAAAWFGQIGGGTQYKFNVSIKALIDNGALRLIE